MKTRHRRRKMLGVLLTFGLIYGMSALVIGADAASPNVKEITIDMVNGWEGDASNLTIEDLPGFHKSTSTFAQAWAAPTDRNAILIYDYSGIYADSGEPWFDWALFNNGGSFAGFVAGSLDHGTIYIHTYCYNFYGHTVNVNNKIYGTGYYYTAREHEFASGWTKDETYHWHACTAEGATDACLNHSGAAKAKHSYGTSGDTRFTCTVCKYVDSGLKIKAEEADKAAADTQTPGQVSTVKTGEDTTASGQVSTVKTGEDTTASGQVPTVKTAEESAQTVSDPITINKVPASVKAKAKKNKVTVTWKKIKKTKKTKKLLSQIKAVQVQVAKDPAFTEIAANKKVGKNKTKVVLKLEKKTTYYIRVRYVGKDGYSNWSKVKRVKTK